MLGAFRVTIGDVVVDESRWARKKAETLIKLLAVEPGHEILRDRLLEMLWPELEPDQALNNFHKAVHAARRALEPELKSGAESRFVVTNDRRISLRAADLWIDAEVFEQQAKKALAADPPSAAEIESSLTLMTGEFLAADRLEDWAAVRRERIAGLHQDLFLRLGTIYERTGDTRQATEILRQAVNVQPANENAHRHLMRLYAATGNRHLALNQFRTCCEILRKDLDAEPESSTVRLHEQRGSVGGWLVMLARSRAIDRLRSRAGRQRREQGSETFDFLAPGMSPEWQALDAERREQSMAALKVLAPDERELLVLAFFRGHTHRELAERLQLPLGIVKTRIRSAMIKLRHRLSPASAARTLSA